MEVFLTERAKYDLSMLKQSSHLIWGTRLTQRYLSLIKTAFRDLEQNATPIGSRAVDDISPGLRRLPLRFVTQKQGLNRVKRPAHVIYYRLRDPNIVEILRILHEHMDVKAQFE